MEHVDPGNVQRQRSSSPHSDASTVSNPSTPPPDAGSLGQEGSLQELASIQEQLQTVLEYVDHGMILKSFDTLSHITDIVVENCESLGLASDGGSGSSVDIRAGFWTGLNNCWLFAFLQSERARSDDQRIKEGYLHILHRKISAWSDTLERYGLVNYEVGLWEQDILDAIEGCLINRMSSPFEDN